MLSPEQRAERARKAALARHHPDRRRALKASALERHIIEATTTAPQLTLAERVRLAAALLDVPGGEAA